MPAKKARELIDKYIPEPPWHWNVEVRVRLVRVDEPQRGPCSVQREERFVWPGTVGFDSAKVHMDKVKSSLLAVGNGYYGEMQQVFPPKRDAEKEG